MPISCIYGLPGKNKTLFSTYYALSIANRFRKCIVANFLFHPDNLLYYCNWMDYQWLISRLKSDVPTIYYCQMESKADIEKLLSIPNSVVICDEAAGYFPARGSTHNTSSQFLKDITQVRHRKQYFLAITQSENLLDTAIRALADEIIYCNGISIFDEKLNAPKLIYKIVRRFTPDKFASWFSNPRLRGNPIKSKMMANKSWEGQLTWADSFLFKVYPSFYLVHEQPEMLKENSYFPDSVTRYQYQKQSTLVGVNAPSASRPGRVIGQGELEFLLNSSDRLKVESTHLPYILQNFSSIRRLTSLERKIFKSLPAELLPLVEKISKLLKKYKLYCSINFSSKYHRLCVCVFIFGLVLIVAFLFSLLSLLIRFIF